MADFQITLQYPKQSLIDVMERRHGVRNVTIPHKHDVAGVVTFLISAVGARRLVVKESAVEDDTALVTLTTDDYNEGWHQKVEAEIQKLQEHILSGAK